MIQGMYTLVKRQYTDTIMLCQIKGENMPKRMYAVVGGRAKKIKKQYVIINGVAKKVKKMYAVVNGVTKQIFGGVDVGEVVFTASTEWTVPEGVTSIDIFCVGGGGGAGGFYSWLNLNINASTFCTGGAGGGGYTNTLLQVPVTPYEKLTIAVGSKGIVGDHYDYEVSEKMHYGTVKNPNDIKSGTSGGKSTVYRGSVLLLSANGGYSGTRGTSTTYGAGGKGGSGGARGMKQKMTSTGIYTETGGGYAGTDGGDAEDYNGNKLAKGQGTTTRAFGEANGTIYSEGGGCEHNNYGNPHMHPNSGMGGNALSSYHDGAAGVVIIRWSAQD